jgi:ADP-ribosylglycohydrolase
VGFEDASQCGVAGRGDADTLAAIAGGLAEAMWGIPDAIGEIARRYVPEEMWPVLRAAYRRTTLRHQTPRVDAFAFNSRLSQPR